MPSIWLKHKNPKVLPFEAHYSEGQNVDAIEASYAEQGWSKFDPKPAQLADLREQSAPVVSESSDSPSKEK